MDRRVSDVINSVHRAAVDTGFRDQKAWDKRLARAKKINAFHHALELELTPKPHFVEAVDYWRRARLLQEMNLGLIPRKKVGDALQEAIPIYDTVERRYAGFSNVLEQLRYGVKAPKYKKNAERGYDYPKFCGDAEAFLYVCLVHRICGSGASFEHDHGWRNTIVPEMAGLVTIPQMAAFVGAHRGPIFTSIGNQIPPFNKITNPSLYRNAGQEYLCETAPTLVRTLYTWLNENEAFDGSGPVGIQVAVDKALEIQRRLGCKQFKFVLTAWVMDIAEYFPNLVNPDSDCYHGKNAQEAMELCFDWRAYPHGKQQFYDAATRAFANITGTHPMDVEDASPGCDLVRWVENYVPKKGFHWVHAQGIFNCNSLVFDKGRQP